MNEQLNRILEIKRNEDFNDVMDMVHFLFNESTSTLTDKQRLSLFDNLLKTVEHADTYSFDILMCAKDIRMIETLLIHMEYKIHRSLNAILSRINDFVILRYLVTHPYANFKVGYRSSEAIRFAVLNNQMDRLVILLCGRHVNVHAKHLTTNSKSAIELAVMFNNKMAIKMFMEKGFVCTHESYTSFVNKYVADIERELSLQKIKLISDLNDSYIISGNLDFNTMLKLLEYNSDPLKELSVTATLKHNFDKIRKLTNGCRRV